MWFANKLKYAIFFGLVFCAVSTVSAQNIHLGVLRGSINEVREALEAGISPDEYNAVGFAPLHVVARAGNIRLARILLEYGANINILSQDGSGDTPLHLAVLNGNRQTIDFLLENGADPNILNSFGNAPIHDSLVVNDGWMAQQLIEDGADSEVLEEEESDVLENLIRTLLLEYSIAASFFTQIPFTDGASAAFYGPFSNEYVRDLFFAAQFQLLVSLNAFISLGLELGTNFSLGVAVNHTHLEIPLHIVLNTNINPLFSTQIYGGGHIAFPDLNTSPDVIFRFDLGTRAEFQLARQHKIFIEAGYVLPIVLSGATSSRSQFLSAAQPANNLRIGVGYRFTFR